MKKHFAISLLISIAVSCVIVAAGIGLYSHSLLTSVLFSHLQCTVGQMEMVIRQNDALQDYVQDELRRIGDAAILEVAAAVGDPSRKRGIDELRAIAAENNVDNIYLIGPDGVIHSSSLKKDIGYNLLESDPVFAEFMKSVYGAGKVESPPATIGSNTGAARKYIYYSPPGSDYIVETSYDVDKFISNRYSPDFYRYVFTDYIKEIGVPIDRLTKLDVFMLAKDKCMSYLNPGLNVEIPPRLKSELRANPSVTTRDGDIMTIYRNLSFSARSRKKDGTVSSGHDTGTRILAATFDISVINQYTRTLIIFLVTSTIATVLVSFWLCSKYFDSTFVSKVLTINQSLGAISRGDGFIPVKLPGRDEFNEIADSINAMAEGIKTRERLIRDKEQRLRFFFEAAPLAIMVLDREGKIAEVNNLLLRLFGYKNKSDALAADIGSLAAAEQDFAKICLAVIAGDGESPRQSSHLFVRKDGGEFWGEVKMAMLAGSEQSRGLIVMISDATEKKKLERQLLQSQKMDALGQLSGGIAHDFNNILAVINGYNKLIRDSISDPETIEYCETLNESTRKAGHLVRQLTAFGNLKDGSLTTKVVNLNDIIHRFLKMIRRILGENIEIEFDGHDNLWPVRVNIEQVEQVLMNLSLNAKDAMTPRNGMGKITLKTHNEILADEGKLHHGGFDPGQYVVLSFKDNGHGMETETMSRIFEPFFTTKPSEKGTGLGLATVYSIVQKHGGIINVDSAPNEGCEFIIHLPAETNGNNPLKAPLDSPEVKNAKKGNGALILLAEDDDDTAKMVETILTRSGWRVERANDGVEALRIFKERRNEVALIFADVMMPKMSGRQLIDEARRAKPGLAAVFFSGYASSMLGGVKDPFIQKPFDPAEMLEIIYDCVNPPEPEKS